MPEARTPSRPPAPPSARSSPPSTTVHPELKDRILDGDEVRRFVNVYVNNEDIRYLDDLATPVAEKDEVSIIPAIAGG